MQQALQRRQIPRRQIEKPEKPRKEPEGVIEATRVFYENQAATAKTIVDRGGAGSSKSYSLVQLFAYKFAMERAKKILIVRKTLPSLRISTLMVWNEVTSKIGIRDSIDVEKVSLNYMLNDSLVHFGSVDDPEKIKSTDWNYIWMEEATEFTYEDFKQLKLRLRAPSSDGKRNQIFLSFNPIDEYHWIKERVIDDPTEETQEIHSTYRDNPYLDVDYVQDLENLQHQDITFYNIYTLGQWGKLENLIYNFGVHWDIVDTWPDLANIDTVVYGLDFGFNKPSALIEVMFKGNEVWERELLYESKLTNPKLIGRSESILKDKRSRAKIFADSAEPDRIQEFKEAGFSAIKPADKNILDGIDIVKQYKVHVHKDSANLIKEKRAYSWRKDRNSNVLDEPVDFMNHAMDAERYAIYTQKRRRGARFTVF